VNRTFLRIGLFVLVVGGLAAGAWFRFSTPPVHRPDILLVVWDTCRVDRLSAFGYARPTSPRLDALAARGVRYTQCFTTAPWTAPSHGSLFTGLLPSVHGQTMVGRRVRQDVPVLAELLQAAGYETALFSANPLLSEATGLSRGFETVVPFFNATEKVKDGPRGVAAIQRWLDARMPDANRKPLFLMVNFMDAHVPLEPPPEHVAAVMDPSVPMADVEAARALDQVAVMAHLLRIRSIDPSTLKGMSVLYDGGIRVADASTGEVIDRLRAAGFLEDGLIVVTSDHGENLGEHGQTEHRASLYETVLHVPLVVYRPGRYEGGATVGTQVSLADVFPTVLREAGVPAPPLPAPAARIGAHVGMAMNGSDGMFRAIALPVPGEPATSRVVFAEQDSFIRIIPGQRATAFQDAPPSAFVPMRTAIECVREPDNAPGARKLLRFLPFAEDGTALPEREEIYDLVRDPDELRDLLGPDGEREARDAAKRLRLLLEVR
jgi:hypothetical protein